MTKCHKLKKKKTWIPADSSSVEFTNVSFLSRLVASDDAGVLRRERDPLLDLSESFSGEREAVALFSRRDEVTLFRLLLVLRLFMFDLHSR